MSFIVRHKSRIINFYNNSLTPLHGTRKAHSIPGPAFNTIIEVIDSLSDAYAHIYGMLLL